MREYNAWLSTDSDYLIGCPDLYDGNCVGVACTYSIG